MSNISIVIQGPPPQTTLLTSTAGLGIPTPQVLISDVTTSGKPAAQSYTLKTGLEVALGVSAGLLLLVLLLVLYVVVYKKCPSTYSINRSAELIRQTALGPGDVRVKEEAFNKLIRGPSIKLKNLARPFANPSNLANGYGANQLSDDEDHIPLVGLRDVLAPPPPPRILVSGPAPPSPARGRPSLNHQRSFVNGPAPYYDPRLLGARRTTRTTIRTRNLVPGPEAARNHGPRPGREPRHGKGVDRGYAPRPPLSDGYHAGTGMPMPSFSHRATGTFDARGYGPGPSNYQDRSRGYTIRDI